MLEISNFIKDEETKRYFEGHLPRFEAQYRIFEECLKDKDIKRVYDIGTWFPFSSYYFAKKGISVIFGCEFRPEESGIENTLPLKIDLENPPDLPQADLVICTECLEHLACNLYTVRDYLKSLVRLDGYLLLSFPTGNIFLDDYDKQLRKYEGTPHLREFPIPKAREFYQGLGMGVIFEETIKTPLYPGADGILQVLLRKS